MTSKTVLIASVLAIVVALLAVFRRKNAEENLLVLFERNIDRSLCVLCLGNDSSCNTLHFQLDYERHAELGPQHSSCLLLFLVAFVRLFNAWTNQQSDRIFFGTLRLNNNTAVPAVAKSPGRYYSEMFERLAANVSADARTTIPDNVWILLPYTVNSRNLVVCSTDSAESNHLHYDFFESAMNVKNNNNNNNNSRLWMEAWIAAHLSVELLILKVLKGYHYVPDVYQTCGRIYFVEDCGRTLHYHLNNMSLNNRLLVARELLKLATELTDGTAHSNYSFYLTDLTAHNIAIQLDSASGTLQSLKVIDWSDVIIVPINRSVTVNNNLVHVSEHIDCGIGCLTYSKEDICQASVSDHNIYAVCKEFLSDESQLLANELANFKNVNELLKKEISLFQSLVKECLWHSDVKSLDKNRFKIAKLLSTVIQQIMSHSLN